MHVFGDKLLFYIFYYYLIIIIIIKITTPKQLILPLQFIYIYIHISIYKHYFAMLYVCKTMKTILNVVAS